jgi:uncharacterized protein (DUF952 family)
VSDTGPDGAKTVGPRFLHLTPAAVWESQAPDDYYTPEAFLADGFIHFTIGEKELLAVGNRYYADDRREYAAVEVDPRRLLAEVKFEDPRRVFPHLHGPLNRDAVTAVWRVRRASDGEFLAIETDGLVVGS